MKWFKKEPIPTPEMKVEDFLTKVYTLHPDRKYLLWFDRSLNLSHVQTLREIFERFAGPNQITIAAGVVAPQIYEFEKEEEKNNDASRNDCRSN
jgi:hypothetical protein